MTLTPLGDQALLIQVADAVGEGALARVQQLAAALRAEAIQGVVSVVPAFTTVGLLLDASADPERVEPRVRAVMEGLPSHPPRVVGEEKDVPVCYGGDFGPDLPHVAGHTGLPVEEIIRLHVAGEYVVHAVGFTPGFPYLAGLSERLATPRRATPRTQVPGGAVAIGGRQTGIYPLASPGGWQLIGRTPRPLFEPAARPPAWLRPGDRVRFRSISRPEYDHLAAEMERLRREMLSGADELPTQGGVQVVRPGVQTTVQDLGRVGWLDQGVPSGGAVDPIALHAANVLVGNPPGAAGLEWVFRGPVLRFDEDRLVVVMGAAPAGVPLGRSWVVRAGETLDCTRLLRGFRGYLAVNGGFDVPVVLDSRSTCARAHFGGLRGRALRAGDRLGCGTASAVDVRGRWQAVTTLCERDLSTPIRYLPGPQAGHFPAETAAQWGQGEFEVSADSDRMGLRLQGPPLAVVEHTELISAPVFPGAIQVPPSGQPIVLLRDCQTLGGYPQLGYVITADLPRLAQAAPGCRLRFVEVTRAEAVAARLAAEGDLGLLRLGVEGKLVPA